MLKVNKLLKIKTHYLVYKPHIRPELNTELPVHTWHLFKMFQDAAAFSAKRT